MYPPPPESVKSNGSQVSKSSVCSSRAQRPKIDAAKALLMQQQAEERSKKLVELEVKKVEMEIKRTELELQHRLKGILRNIVQDLNLGGQQSIP